MNGRDKCNLLNEIRQKVADENNIEFKIYDCTFEGDCTGTCPKCESELEYLEQELEKKQNAGEKINIKNIFTLDEKEECVGIDCVDKYHREIEELKHEIMKNEETIAVLEKKIIEKGRLQGLLIPDSDEDY